MAVWPCAAATIDGIDDDGVVTVKVWRLLPASAAAMAGRARTTSFVLLLLLGVVGVAGVDTRGGTDLGVVGVGGPAGLEGMMCIGVEGGRGDRQPIWPFSNMSRSSGNTEHSMRWQNTHGITLHKTVHTDGLVGDSGNSSELAKD